MDAADINYPRVLDEAATITALLGGKSIARYGDGELKLMDGKEYLREPPSENLASELLRVFQAPDRNCIVGVPTLSPKGPKYKNWMRHAARFARYMRPDVQYYSAFITRPDSAPWINTEKFAAQVERLWRKKNVVVLSEPRNSILIAVRMSAKSVEHVDCPSREAYGEIDRLQEAITTRRPDVALLSCGPTATCLANRLAAIGIQAVDIGSAGGYLVKLLIKRMAVA